MSGINSAKQSLLALFLSIALVACGGDSTASANDDEISSSSWTLSSPSAGSGTSDSRATEAIGSSSSKKTVSGSSSKKTASSSSTPRNDNQVECREQPSTEAHDRDAESCAMHNDVKSSSSSIILSSSSRHSGLDSESSDSLSSKSDWIWDVSFESLLNPKIKYGSMTDSRDGQTYKTVKIGNQVWMAQNLN